MNRFNNTDIYSEAKDACPICSGKSLKEHYLIDKFKLPFKTDRCLTCGFIFMNPTFTKKIITDFYDKDYFTGSADYSYVDERETKKHAAYVWDKRIKVLSKHAKGKKFLDIGASFGGLMESAKKYYEPYGIEISDYAGSFSKKIEGCTVHIGTLGDHPFEHETFGAISMIEVIEHMPDPVSIFNECYKLLEKNGLLVIQTANMDGIQARLLGNKYSYFLPGHLSYFSKKNIEIILKKTGFKKISFFYPVEFGLIPKLKKSQYSFKSIWDYKSWIRITFYHFLSKLHFRNFAATSSMVIYAMK